MEALLQGLILGILGYLVQEIRSLRKELNHIENELLVMKVTLPKRHDDDIN